MSGEAVAVNFECRSDPLRSQCVDPVGLVTFSDINIVRRDDDDELNGVLLDACSSSPVEEHFNLMSQIKSQLRVISKKNVSDIEKLQEKEKVLESAIDVLGAQNRDLIITISILKEEAEQRMILLDKHLDRTAHATKDMVINLSNWGQEIKDLIVLKYQAEDAIKESQAKVLLLTAENTALKDQNANLLHDIQSLLKIIRQARTKGHWEMECVTFCEIAPEDVYGPVCGMSLKQSHDSADWADVHGCDRPDSPHYAASEKSSLSGSRNGSTSHCLNYEGWMEHSEFHKLFVIQRLERKLVDCQLEILEKDKIIADLEGQITSLNYEITMRNVDCEAHLPDRHWYQEVFKDSYHCPEASLLGSQRPCTAEGRSNRPHQVDASTQADFSSAPKDQLCFVPYTESCPALNAIGQEDVWHSLSQPQYNVLQRGTEEVCTGSGRSRVLSCEQDICQPNSALTSTTDCYDSHTEHLNVMAACACLQGRRSQEEIEGSDNVDEVSSGQPQKSSAQMEQVQTTLTETLNGITHQGDICLLPESSQAYLHEQCKLIHGEEYQDKIVETSRGSPLPQLPLSSVSEKPTLLLDTSLCTTDSAFQDIKSDASSPAGHDNENSFQVWTVDTALEGESPGAMHGSPNARSAQIPSNVHQHKSDSITQTECSLVAMGVQTDFRLECSSVNSGSIKSQEVESLKEQLNHMEEKVSSKNILVSQLQTHLETACREVELKDKALANVERKLESKRQQCDSLKNDLNVLVSKAKGLEEQVEELLKVQQDMEKKMQKMKATEQELHEQKRSLLIQLDSAAEESVMYKEEAKILRNQLDLKTTEVEHQYATICNLQEALLLSKSTLESMQQQMTEMKFHSYASNGQIHNI